MKDFLLFSTALLFLSVYSKGQDLYGVKQHLWKAQKDDVYLQESSEKIRTDHAVLSLAVYKGQCYGIIAGNLFVLEGSSFTRISTAPTGINKLKLMNGQLWALTKEGLYVLDQSHWQKSDNRLFVDLCMHQSLLHGATEEEVYRLQEGKFVSIKPKGGYYSSDMTMLQEDGTQINDTPVSLGPITRIESHNGTLYVLRPGELVLFDGLIVNRDFIDWGRLPSNQTNDLLSLGSRLMIGTDRGLAVLRGASLTTLSGKDGLPVEQTYPA